MLSTTKGDLEEGWTGGAVAGGAEAAAVVEFPWPKRGKALDGTSLQNPIRSFRGNNNDDDDDDDNDDKDHDDSDDHDRNGDYADDDDVGED